MELFEGPQRQEEKQSSTWEKHSAFEMLWMLPLLPIFLFTDIFDENKHRES
jgi:hypothetical protein